MANVMKPLFATSNTVKGELFLHLNHPSFVLARCKKGIVPHVKEDIIYFPIKENEAKTKEAVRAFIEQQKYNHYYNWFANNKTLRGNMEVIHGDVGLPIGWSSKSKGTFSMFIEDGDLIFIFEADNEVDTFIRKLDSETLHNLSFLGLNIENENIKSKL